MADSLVSAAGDAGKHLGLAAVEFGWFPDQRLDTVPILELTQHIEEVVTRLRPTILYTHFPGDVNADHGIVVERSAT